MSPPSTVMVRSGHTSPAAGSRIDALRMITLRWSTMVYPPTNAEPNAMVTASIGRCNIRSEGRAMESAENWVRYRTDGTPLGPKSERVVHLLATQAEFTSFASASAVAGRAGVDAATVVRTARALGFSGWPDLRLELRNRYLSSLRANEVLNEHEDAASDPIVHALRSDVDNVMLAIRTIDVAQVRAIAAAIA